jgi:hypothetical protein
MPILKRHLLTDSEVAKSGLGYPIEETLVDCEFEGKVSSHCCEDYAYQSPYTETL